MFCDNCGEKNEIESKFCTNCGNEINAEKKNKWISIYALHFTRYLSLLKNNLGIFKNLSPLKVIGIFFSIFLIFIAVHFFKSYQQTQIVIERTAKELQETQAKLSDIASSTSQKLILQAQELSRKDSQIQKLQSDFNSGQRSTAGANSNLLTSLSSSVVKIICASNSYNDDLQTGSGVLYHSTDGDPANYYVETNLHVVQTYDDSRSQCAVILYPNYANTSNYLIYQTSGYQIYKYGADFAYIFPKIANVTHAGTMADLSKYAKNKNSNTYCKTTSIGDHISILGYPGVGGSSITATDGIISGFETDDGIRYIKTSAKIEHGNSGGLAVKDSGCVLGIPTFVETGRVESIGRILDLNNLFQ